MICDPTTSRFLPFPPSTQTYVLEVRPVVLQASEGLLAVKTSGVMPYANCSFSHVSPTTLKYVMLHVLDGRQITLPAVICLQQCLKLSVTEPTLTR